jgi:hypothetical protein
LHEVDIQDLTNMETVWFTFLEKVMGEETTLLGLVLLIGDVVATGSGAPRNSQWSQIYRGKWTDTTIRAILVNPLYIGDMVWNRRTDGRFHRISAGRAVDRECAYGSRLVPNATHDWIVVRETHPAIISHQVFELAKTQRESHPCSGKQRGINPNHGKTWHGKRSHFVLSGLMKCALCGSRYQGVTRHKGKRRVDGTKVKTRSYGCAGSNRSYARLVFTLYALDPSCTESNSRDTELILTVILNA